MKSKLNMILLFLMSSKISWKNAWRLVSILRKLETKGYAWKNPINMIYRGWNLSPSMIASEAYP